MKNNIKATKMQLAKKHPVKTQISSTQTKKVSTELERVGERLKHDRRARSAKQVSCYVGMDLGDKKRITASWMRKEICLQKELWQRHRRS